MADRSDSKESSAAPEFPERSTIWHLFTWTRGNESTAADFLAELSRDSHFHLDAGSISRILDLLRDPVPYHVQLFFSALRDASGSNPSRVSPKLIERCFAERLTGASGTAHLDHYVARLEVSLEEHEYELAREVLNHTCRRRDGTSLGELMGPGVSDERTFQAVLRDLEADGYLIRESDRFTFRSNLLREWWRRHHGGGLGA